MKNRVFSAITAFIMLISCLIITTASAAEYIEYELGNFRGESKNANVSGGTTSQANDFGYGENTSSLLWTVNASAVNYNVENKTDWTEYEEVHIRLHSSVEQKVNVVFCGTSDGAVSGKYTQKKAALTGTNWQDVVIPISELTTGLNASDDKKHIQVIVFNGYGWGNSEFVKNSKVHIDSIYLTKTGFQILNTQPEDNAAGVDASEGFKYTINFNKKLDAKDYSEYISVADASGNVADSYTVTASDKAITLTFGTDLMYETEYTVTVAGELSDAEGNTLGEDCSFTFTTGGEPLKLESDGVIFSADSDADMTNILTNGAVEETDNSFIFDRAAKIEYNAGVDKTAVLAYKHGDISGYTHINYFMYNPKANNEKINMLMYDKKGGYYHNTITTDWTGWKLISQTIPTNAAADPTSMVRFSMNFGALGNARSEDGYVILGKAWFSDYEIGALSLTETEYENEASYVPSDLGGDNRYSFTFDRELEAVIGEVEVSRLSGGEYVPYKEEFTAETDGNNLNVLFASGLEDGGTYKISVPSDCVLAKDFGMNDEASEVSFTVGADAPYFRLVSVSPENEAMITETEDFTVTLTFNKTPNKMLNHEDYISVYKGDDKQFGIFDAEIDGNSVALHFTKALEAGKKYSVKINEEYSDNYNNKISGNTETVFYTYEEASGDTDTLFSAGDADNLSNIASINGSASANMTNTNLHSSNLKCYFPANKDIGVFIMRDNVKSTLGMKYVNFWFYSPEVLDEDMNIAFYTDRSSNKYTRYTLRVNWEGWKLVSVPLTEVSSPAKLDSVAINFGGWSTPHNKSVDILVDEAWLSAAEPSAPLFISSSVPDGYIGVAAEGPTITYEFDKELNANKGALVTVTNKLTNEAFADYTAQISDNKLAVKFGRLDENTEYQIEINGLCSKMGVEQSTPVVNSFTTAGRNVYVSSINFENTELNEGGVLTANFEIANSGSKRGNVICKLNLYDENNILISKREYGISCDGMSEKPVAVSADINKGASYAVAYVVNFDGDVVSDKFVMLKNGRVSTNNQIIVAGDNAKLQLDSANININNLSVTGTVKGMSNTVILTITDSDKNIITAIPLSADTNGKFEYGCRMPSEAQSGKYTVTATGGEMKNDTVTFNYVSNADRDDFLTLSNGSNVNAAAQWMSRNAEAVGIANYSSEQITDLAKVLLEQEAYGTYKEAINSIGKIADMLNGLNSCTWAGMGDYLDKFHVMALGKNSADYTYFAGLSERNRNAILIDVAKSMPAQTISKFRSIFSAAVSAYKNAVPTTKPDINGGGSSGGGGASGGGGGGGKDSLSGNQSIFMSQIAPSGNTEKAPQPTISPQKELFNDLADYSWAKKSIEALCNKGIIEKSENFRPGDSITREEFVKLIVCAFCDGLTTVEHEFSDADKNAWYSAYLWTAYEENIVEGYSDGRFGIGDSITREDMVTMACRAIAKIGKMQDLKVNDVYLNYSDADSISDYALEYVKIMTSCGVVSGMGDGSFAPKAVTNRAQAAMVIYQLLELTE